MPSNRNRLVAMLATATLAGGGAGAGVVALTHNTSRTTTVVTPAATNVANVAVGALSVGQVAKTDGPSVVEVDATLAAGGAAPFPYGSGQPSSQAEGSGFVYDTKGDIVTNQHVVAGASSVSVKFSDGSTYKATVVGADPSTDIAVLHVDAPASKLVPLVLADSSKVAVGDGVVAIGNPFGLDGTVTSGIVSAVNREIQAPDSTPIEGAIQTDAAINHGNSGGPLLDMNGKVIGITSQIQSQSGASDGVGFAVPSNMVQSIAAQLIATGKAQHALLGVSVSTAPNGNGVSVGSVETGSAAKNAGLKAGDVITAVDGAKVATAAQLRAIIAGRKPGDKLSITVLRGRQSKTFDATLGSRS